MRRSAVRDRIATVIRALPTFRGKGPLIRLLSRVLVSPREEGALARVRMKDGSLLLLDVRSSTEATAYWAGGYDTEIIQRLSGFLEPGSVVLDVGANVGFYTVPLARRLSALGGHLYAFEPIPSNFRRLQDVIQLNGLSEAASALCFALGDRSGEVGFWLDDRDPAGTGNAVLVQGAVRQLHKANVTARMVRLDDFAAEHAIDRCHLIKVDVEGAEVLILRGAEEFIRRTRPVIYGEFSAYWMARLGHSFASVYEMVRPWGYELYRKCGRSEFALMKEGEQAENVLLVPREKQAPIEAWVRTS
jgi:FkbM family methyltransferase